MTINGPVVWMTPAFAVPPPNLILRLCALVAYEKVAHQRLLLGRLDFVASRYSHRLIEQLTPLFAALSARASAVERAAPT
jgi:hypothetical protein